jgi:hypothetical protein
MQFAKRLFMGLGAVALMAVLLTLAAPKAVRGVVATLVQVTNTVSTTESLGTDPILQASCTIYGFPNGGNLVGKEECYTVPAGKRAVIEEVDGYCGSPSQVSLPYMLTGVAGASVIHTLPLQQLQSGYYPFAHAFSLTTPVRFYSDPGTSINFAAGTDDLTGQSTCTFTITGRLLPSN